MCSGIAGLGDIDTMMVVDLYPIHVRITDSSVISETQFREILFNTFPEWATLRYVIEGGRSKRTWSRTDLRYYKRCSPSMEFLMSGASRGDYHYIVELLN